MTTILPITNKVTLDDMACRCSNEEELRCILVKEWAGAFISKYLKRKARPDNFSTLICDCLLIFYGVYEMKIRMDQWGVISSYTTKVKDNESITFIQYDQIEDGLTFTLKALYDYYGEPTDE